MKKRVCGLVILYVLSLTLVNHVRAQDVDHYSPFMLSIVNPIQIPPDDFYVGGLKLNLVYGECHDFLGLDVGLFGHCSGDAHGLHIGGVTVIGGDGNGFMIDLLANHVVGEYGGMQIGFYNYAGHMNGLQIGVINIADTAYGIQIGAVNVIRDNDIPFIPIINGYF